MLEFLSKDRVRNADVFDLVSAVGDTDSVIVFAAGIMVEVGIDALNRRSVDGFSVKGFSRYFDPNSADDFNVVFKEQLDDAIQKAERMAFKLFRAAQSVSSQVGAFDFRDDSVKEFIGRIV